MRGFFLSYIFSVLPFARNQQKEIGVSILEIMLCVYVGGAILSCFYFIFIAMTWDGSHGKVLPYWLGVQLDLQPRYVFVVIVLLLSVLWLLFFCCLPFIKVHAQRSRKIPKDGAWGKVHTIDDVTQNNTNNYEDPSDSK